MIFIFIKHADQYIGEFDRVFFGGGALFNRTPHNRFIAYGFHGLAACTNGDFFGKKIFQIAVYRSRIRTA